jgi:hypothetical protein
LRSRPLSPSIRRSVAWYSAGSRGERRPQFVRGVRRELKLPPARLLDRGQRPQADRERPGEHGQQQHRRGERLTGAQQRGQVLVALQALARDQPRAVDGTGGEPERSLPKPRRRPVPGREAQAGRESGRACLHRHGAAGGRDLPQVNGRGVDVVVITAGVPQADLADVGQLLREPGID